MDVDFGASEISGRIEVLDGAELSRGKLGVVTSKWLETFVIPGGSANVAGKDFVVKFVPGVLLVSVAEVIPGVEAVLGREGCAEDKVLEIPDVCETPVEPVTRGDPVVEDWVGPGF